MTVLATYRDGTNSLDVDGVCRAEDTIAETTDNRLIHVEKGHHVEELLNLQRGDVLLNLHTTRHLGRQQVITAPLAATIAPLCQADHGIRVTGSGQEQMCQGLGHVPLQVHRVVRHQETNEQVPQAWGGVTVAERRLHALPEWQCQVELFNLVPARWRCTQVDLMLVLDVGARVEQGAEDGEEFRL